jgi:spore coat polysaccharide biosynthesis predicted glycosyltransferase SpsG
MFPDYRRHFVVKELHPKLKVEFMKYFDFCYELGSPENFDEQNWWQQELTGNEMVILDGYKFDTEYQAKLKKMCSRLICVDDIHAYHFCADAVLNHAGGLSSSIYDKEPYTKLFLGPSYAIVRSIFWNKPSVSTRVNNHVFVCLGGADPRNDLVQVLITALVKGDSLNFHVVTGAAYQYEKELKKILADHRNVKHYKNLNGVSLMEIMQKSAIAICSPSTVSYEYLSIGGELYLYPIAGNQANIYRYFIQTSLAFPFEEFGQKTEKQVSEVLKNQSRIFDGKSHIRIREALLNA